MVDIQGATLKSFTTYLQERTASSSGVSMSAGLNAAGSAVVAVAPPVPNILDFVSDDDDLSVDSTAVFARAFAYAVTSGQWAVYVPGGNYVFDADSATSLSTTTYGYGDVALKACMVKPYGLRLMTAGYRTEFRITNVDATTCGIAITEDTYSSPSTHSQTSDIMEPFMLRPMDASGRYGIVTPKVADLFLNKRPNYNMAVHFAGHLTQQMVTNYGWDYGIKIGDCRGGDVYFEGAGTYNAAAVDAGQHNMTGLHVDSLVGCYGVKFRFNAANMRQFFVGGDGLEGFSLVDSEGLGCWEGVVLESSGGEPGGFIDNIHTNSNRAGYRFENRPFLHVGKLEAYRSDDFFDHASDWDGIILNDCTGVDVSHILVSHGGLLDRVNSRAGSINGSTLQLTNWVAHGVKNGMVLSESPNCQFGDARVNTVENVYAVSGSGSTCFKAANVVNSGGTTTFYVVFSGGAPRSRAMLPQKTSLQTLQVEAITMTVAATKTVKKRLTASDLAITMSTAGAPFTYDVILDRDTAIPGDLVTIKVNGSGSADPTLRVCDHSTATILSTFNSLGGTKRLYCTYRLTDSNTWQEVNIIDSVEGTY